MAAHDWREAGPPDSTIIRVDKSRGCWEAIPVALIRDRRLELDTLGLIVWLLAMPDAWEIRIMALPRLLKSTTSAKRFGRERLRRMLHELERAGYLTRTRMRTANGRWYWRSVLSALSTIDGFATDGSTVVGRATGGKPVDLSQTLGISEGFITDPTHSRDAREPEKSGLAGKRKKTASSPTPASQLARGLLDELRARAERSNR